MTVKELYRKLGELIAEDAWNGRRDVYIEGCDCIGKAQDVTLDDILDTPDTLSVLITREP